MLLQRKGRQSAVTSGEHRLPWWIRWASSRKLTVLVTVMAGIAAILSFLARTDPGAYGGWGFLATVVAALMGLFKVIGDSAAGTRVGHERRKAVASAASKLKRLTDELGRHGSGMWPAEVHDGFRQSVAETLQDIFSAADPSRSFRVLLYQAPMAEAVDPDETDPGSGKGSTRVLRLVGCALNDGSDPPDRLTKEDATDQDFPNIFPCFEGRGGLAVSSRPKPPPEARWKSAVYVRVNKHRERPGDELRPPWGTIHADSPRSGRWVDEPYYHNLLTLAASLLSVAASHVDTQMTKVDQRDGMAKFEATS